MNVALRAVGAVHVGGARCVVACATLKCFCPTHPRVLPFLRSSKGDGFCCEDFVYRSVSIDPGRALRACTDTPTA